VLKHYNPNIGCTLHTDARTEGLGAILLQEGEDKQNHPIAYISRLLSKAEQNYSISELELLAAVWGMAYSSHLPYLILLRPVIIVTDHHALCWIHNIKHHSRRLTRWALKLAEFDYSVVYKKGSKHQDADCLSRNPVLHIDCYVRNRVFVRNSFGLCF